MFKSNLDRQGAVGIGLMEAAGIYLIYNNALPNCADVRSAQPHDTAIDGARRGAAIKSTALLGIVFLISRDLNAFIVGGVALVGIDAMYKHANGINPGTNKLDKSDMGTSIAPSLSVATPLASYSDDSDQMAYGTY